MTAILIEMYFWSSDIDTRTQKGLEPHSERFFFMKCKCHYRLVFQSFFKNLVFSSVAAYEFLRGCSMKVKGVRQIAFFSCSSVDRKTEMDDRRQTVETRTPFGTSQLRRSLFQDQLHRRDSGTREICRCRYSRSRYSPCCASELVLRNNYVILPTSDKIDR